MTDDKKNKLFIIEEADLLFLGSFLLELPYKYKDKIDHLMAKFGHLKQIKIPESNIQTTPSEES